MSNSKARYPLPESSGGWTACKYASNMIMLLAYVTELASCVLNTFQETTALSQQEDKLAGQGHISSLAW